MKVYNIGGWLAVALLFVGLNTLRHEPAYTHSPYAVAVDTVTYDDARIVYKLATDTARNSAGDLRRLPDLTAAPTGARWRVIWKPSTFDSVMLVTGDTFAMSPMDSADATALATSWGVTDPHTVNLAWHTDPGSAPDPLTNVMVAAVHDTLRTSWTSTSDSVRVFSGLDAGGQEDTAYVAGSATPHDRVVTSIPGDYYSCGNAYTTQADGDYSANRCGSATVDTASGGGDHPNEPSGYTQITERGFSAYDEDGWSNNGTANYTVAVSDGTAPMSPSDVGQIQFNAGFSGGGGAATVFRNFTGKASLYVHFAVKHSSNWQGHDSGVNKIIFITNNSGDSYGGGGDPAFFSAQGANNATLNFQVRLQGPGNEASQSAGSNLGANLASASMARGTWHEFEVVLVANTGTNFNGEVHVWKDGTKTHEYTDVKFFDDSAESSDHNFDQVKWNPTWGGVGDTVEETMQVFIDHIYVSGS